MGLRLIGKIWYCYFVEDGKQHTLSLHTTDRALAVRMADDLRQCRQIRKRCRMIALASGETLPPPAPIAPARLTMSAALDYAQRAAQKDFRASAVKRWQAFTVESGCRYLDEVTPRHVQAFLDRHFSASAAKTFNNAKGDLNAVFRRCLVRAGLAQSPATPVMQKRLLDVVHHRPITEDEFRRICSAAPPLLRLAVCIGWYTGLRLKDVCRLSSEDIQNGWITIVPAKTARFGRAVRLPVADRLAAVLAGKSGVFVGEKKAHAITCAFSAVCRSLGIADTADGKISFHSLRCSFVTRCDALGIPRPALRGVVGHTSDDITDLYSYDITGLSKIKDL